MKRASFVIVLCVSLVTLSGCEAFARKFTRKPKDRKADFDVVLAPEHYDGGMQAPADQARQSYVFWKSWHVELIAALENGQGYKRRVHCAKEAHSNLRRFAEGVKEDLRPAALGFADELAIMEGLVGKDASGRRNPGYARRAGELLRRIERAFRFSRIEEYVRE